MLVLTVKNDGSVFINKGTPEEVKVTLLTTRKGQVQLGFEADTSIPIVRDNAKVKEPKNFNS